MNRKKFQFKMKDRVIIFFGWLSCCNKRRSDRFSKAKRRSEIFSKGKKKLTHDLDIVGLIKRDQMHDVNKRVLYDETERFLLEF